MKVVFVSILLLAGVLFNSTGIAQGIKFEELELEDAISKAADPAAPKLVFVDCFTSWCVPCIEMARTEFPKKVLGDFFNPKFISVSYDMEKGEGIEIRKKYDVNVFPTFLILDASGNEINRVVGKAGAEEFIEKIKSALSPNNSMTGLKAAYEKNKSMSTGYPYADALAQNGKDPSAVMDELFENSQDFERFSVDFLQLALGTVKFGSPFFKKLMFEKARIDAVLGTEVTNRIIFNKVRKDMYSIANENGAKYNVYYTPQEVEDVAYTIALLKLDPQEPENHMCRIALYVVNKDLDGMIAYYKRNIGHLPSNTVFKGILDGILMSKMPKATAAQKAAIKAYYEYEGKQLEKEAKQYLSKSENIKY